MLIYIQYRCAFSSNLGRIFNCALSSHLSKIFKIFSIQRSTVTELFRSVAVYLGGRSRQDAPGSTRLTLNSVCGKDEIRLIAVFSSRQLANNENENKNKNHVRWSLFVLLLQGPLA